MLSSASLGASANGLDRPGAMRRHGVGVAPGHDQPGAFPLRGTDRAEDIGPFGALVAGRPRARATSGPSACELILLADAGFILPPQISTPFGSLARIFEFGGEVFFKASTGCVVARPRRDLGEAGLRHPDQGQPQPGRPQQPPPVRGGDRLELRIPIQPVRSAGC